MKNLFILLFSALLIFGCKKETKIENPFFSAYNTPFDVPPFDRIDTTHYLPAFIEGIRQDSLDIEKIVNNTEDPTFGNTILAFDRSGQLLTRVADVFFNLNEANTNEQMQDIARKVDPLISKHADDIFLNEKLFQRIKAVYEKRAELQDSQKIRVTEKYYRDFERRGANLPADKKEELRNVNSELSMLSLTFGENLLAETNKNFKLVIEDSADLDGLPEGIINAAAEAANVAGLNGKWVFTLAKPSWIPFLKYSTKRDLREKLYRGYFMRGDNGNENDNNMIAAKIINLRVQKAHILGYPDYAGYVIEENMAKTPQNASHFLIELWKPALEKSKQELAEMQKMIDAEGGNFRLAPWDWWYYAEKVRKAKYDLDENEIRPYFNLVNVRDGMFMVADKLYGIKFIPRRDIPVYEKNVEAFEVTEADGQPLGVLYLDYYPRDGKSVGAWCTGFRQAIRENGKRIDPVVSVVFNFTSPSAGTPSLLTWEEVTTMFHEFGHALHSLFTQGDYYRTAGDVARDYVELPSQVMENWAGEPEVMKVYAKHYKTGEVIPDGLISKIQKSNTFNQGFEMVEYLAASLLDLDYHILKDTLNMNVADFEKQSMKNIGLISEIIPRYRTTYFSHIFEGGYEAGYYVYNWAELLDADAFNAFKESGDIYNQDLAAKFRKYCLAESGDDDGMVQYRKFRGQDPDVEPMLIRRGLK